MNRKQDFEFIKGFSKISIRSVCKELKIDYANVMKNKASEKNINNVKECICRKIYYLLNNGGD